MPAHGRRQTASCCRRSAGLAASRGGRTCASLRLHTLRKDALFFFFTSRPPHISKQNPGQSGFLAMSSMLGVVRKQLKSHPAVSSRPGRLRPMPSGDIERAAEDARPLPVSPKRHLMAHHLIQSLKRCSHSVLFKNALGDLPHRAAFLKHCFHSKFLNIVIEIWNQTDGRGSKYLTIPDQFIFD